MGDNKLLRGLAAGLSELGRQMERERDRRLDEEDRERARGFEDEDRERRKRKDALEKQEFDRRNIVLGLQLEALQDAKEQLELSGTPEERAQWAKIGRELERDIRQAALEGSESETAQRIARTAALGREKPGSEEKEISDALDVLDKQRNRLEEQFDEIRDLETPEAVASKEAIRSNITELDRQIAVLQAQQREGSKRISSIPEPAQPPPAQPGPKKEARTGFQPKFNPFGGPTGQPLGKTLAGLPPTLGAGLSALFKEPAKRVLERAGPTLEEMQRTSQLGTDFVRTDTRLPIDVSTVSPEQLRIYLESGVIERRTPAERTPDPLTSRSLSPFQGLGL